MAKKEEFTDAIMLLKHDHREVEDLFSKFQKASSQDKKWQLAQQICNELKIHTMIEEEIFYPAFEGKVDDDLYHEAYVEHDGAKVLVNDILASGGEGEFFEAKVTVLCEEVDHHVKEEEKSKDGFFAQARDTDVDLKALRDEMLARKEELMQQLENGGLPPAEMRALSPMPA
ncbi:hemerythrin domain-containing protein [Altererythrobacter soli]|uniref:Hemerythrin domain-containing protein n=1 Tax=Croceibacterium soli TaxID=1739690 RepID=A0A6I4UXW8_9SPHN|nr:hemerythrin domain-containing protein [Croceibacterium soli]MXP42433.1 hemerythrin domain-containing protein [Croceibacterium soli]